MRIYDPDYVSQLKSVTYPFIFGAASDVLLIVTNWSQKPIYIHDCIVRNGETAGTTTPAAFDIKTSNSEYVVTFSSGTMPAGMAARTQFIGAEPLNFGKSFILSQKTATTAANEGEITLLIQD